MLKEQSWSQLARLIVIPQLLCAILTSPSDGMLMQSRQQLSSVEFLKSGKSRVSLYFGLLAGGANRLLLPGRIN